MPYNTILADRIREYFANVPNLKIEEKKMFRGLTFMVNGKMCISVSGNNLMCRFDPALHETVAEKRGFQPMIMKKKNLPGYCYVSPERCSTKKELAAWISLCLDFNDRAKASKK
jgi:TfoX/Sxy family transcriptional regulator of competence genes